MPANPISNCQCFGRYGRDEVKGERAARGCSPSFSTAKRNAVVHESKGCNGKEECLMQNIPYRLLMYFLFSAESSHKAQFGHMDWCCNQV